MGQLHCQHQGEQLAPAFFKCHNAATTQPTIAGRSCSQPPAHSETTTAPALDPANNATALCCAVPVSSLQLWAVKGANEELRIAILNKDIDKSCNLELRLEHTHCRSKANLSRMLPGYGGIFSKAGVTIRGQHYMEAGITGQIQGQPESEDIAPIAQADGSCKLVVSAPAITGTILVVPGVPRN